MCQNGSPISLSGPLPLPKKKKTLLRVLISSKKDYFLYVNFYSKRKKKNLLAKEKVSLVLDLSPQEKQSPPPKIKLLSKKKGNPLSFLIFYPFITDSPMEIIYVLSF